MSAVAIEAAPSTLASRPGMRIRLTRTLPDRDRRIVAVNRFYGADNSATGQMKELQARIDAVDNEIATEQSNILGGLQRAFAIARGEEAALRAKVDSLKGDVQDLRSRSIDYNILAREVETQRVQYEALLQRARELSAAGNAGASQVSIIDRAEAPTVPFEPSLKVALVRGMFLSLFIGVALAFLIDFLDDAIKTPEHIRSRLGLPIIGVIPRVRGAVAFRRQLSDPRSDISAAFSSIRNAVSFAIGTGRPFTLLMTGVRPGEGKSSASLALAIAFAGVGRRVLIIDADLRRPSFASAESVGLVGLLQNSEPLESAVVEGQSDRIFLLPAGRPPRNPAELLSTNRLTALLAEARERFDVVIVDSPPVLEFADAPALAAACDAVIMALPAGAVRTAPARRACERLHEAGGRVIGALLTKFKASPGSAYSYASAYGKPYRYTGNAPANARRRVTYFASSARHDRPGK